MGRHHNNIQIPGGMGNIHAIPQQQPMMSIAAPMNDVQTVALIAAMCPGPAPEAVERGMAILVEAFERQDELSARLQAAMKRRQEKSRNTAE